MQRLRVARPELNERQALEELAAWCHQFSPSAGVEQAESPECLFLDITGLEHLFGSEASLGERILQAFGDRRLAARGGIADTLGAAWAVAHFGEVGAGSLSLWERVRVRARRCPKPPSLTIVCTVPVYRHPPALTPALSQREREKRSASG